MTKLLKYPEAYEQIKKVRSANEKLFKTIGKQLDSFIDNLKDYDKKLSKVSWDLPKKLKKRIKIGDLQGAAEFPGLAASFETSFLSAGQQALPSFFQLSFLAENIEKSLKIPFKDIEAEYNEQMVKLESAISSSLKTWHSVQNDYDRAHNSYIKHCEKIEDVHQKIISPNANKNPDQLQKYKTQYSDLKLEYNNLQNKAIKALDDMNEASIHFSFEMEKYLTTFEVLDERKTQRIQEVLEKFKAIIASVSEAKDQSCDIIKSQFESINLQEDISKFIVIPEEPTPIYVPFDAQPLCFSMDEYAPPKKFKDWMESKDYIVTEDFEGVNPLDMSVKKDTILMFLREEKVKKNKEMLFMDPSTNRVGYVPKDKVKLAPVTIRKFAVNTSNGKPCIILQDMEETKRAMDYRGNIYVESASVFQEH